MNPYFQLDQISLYNCDARDIAPSLSGHTVVSDPPYNVGYHYEGYKDNLASEEYHELLKATLRVPSVVIHYPETLFELSWILEEIPRKMVSWVYNANTPRQWRGIAWYGTADPDFNRGGQPYKNPTDKRIAALMAQGKQARLYDWWQISQVKNVSAEKTDHPCQIPFEVMRRILEITPDVPIFEPFAGSGTTLVAAWAAGRPCVASESNEAYCEIIAKRLEKLAAEEVPTLFDAMAA